MTQNQNLKSLRQVVLDRISYHEEEIAKSQRSHGVEIAKFQKMLSEFDQAFFNPAAPSALSSIPKRRGPKPGFKRAAQLAAAQAAAVRVPAARPGPKPKVKGKPGPKPRAAIAAAPKQRRGPNRVTNAATGRREVLENKRPKLKDAITLILKAQTMNASMIYEKLNAKGWLPNSNEPRVYIAQFLSANKDTFERVPSKGRGFYRAAAPTTTSNTPTASTPISDTDATLAEVGIVAPAN